MAKSKLKYPVVLLNGVQAREVARGFALELKKANRACFACAVMPDHAHLVIGRGDADIEDLMIDLKASATHALLQSGIHPFQSYHEQEAKVPKIWARGGRKVFLFDPERIRRTIDYVNRNPAFDRLPRQHWRFVEGYCPQQ